MAWREHPSSGEVFILRGAAGSDAVRTELHTVGGTRVHQTLPVSAVTLVGAPRTARYTAASDRLREEVHDASTLCFVPRGVDSRTEIRDVS